MTRIPGAERYCKYIKFLLFALIVSFAIWPTPRNLPLTGEEVGRIGGSQYHPALKFLGLMPAKNAVVNLIILSTSSASCCTGAETRASWSRSAVRVNWS